MSVTSKKAIIICGATASGKTDFAHKMALRNGGEIVGADAMQLYRQIPIITASPSSELKNELPYHLYNFQNIDEEFSAAKYVIYASNAIRKIHDLGKSPIIVGGSGMYINMLINGYSNIPDIAPDVRDDTRKLFNKIGLEDFLKKLKEIDFKISQTNHISDPQRAIRAYEVIRQTGKSIISFQEEDNIKPLPEFAFDIILLSPERNFLYEMCNMRLVYMFNNGAIEEVEAIYKEYGEDLQTSAMKALGISEIISYIKGDITKDDALFLASRKTRQYAKRQNTWFNNQVKGKKQVIGFSNEKEYRNLSILIRDS